MGAYTNTVDLLPASSMQMQRGRKYGWRTTPYKMNKLIKYLMSARIRKQKYLMTRCTVLCKMSRETMMPPTEEVVQVHQVFMHFDLECIDNPIRKGEAHIFGRKYKGKRPRVSTRTCLPATASQPCRVQTPDGVP